MVTGYCLVETTAPQGHELQADAIYFVVNKGATETVGLTNVTVKDVQRNAGFELPLTGGNGIWLILAAGGLLVVIGGGYYYVSKRRENA
ncbi:hypothetical protein CFRA_06685 [Corynebacterium frankenforstense DSM 45800]|uniref:Gram-positive cocci surface proteins LPxTG domain-containing protein n=1 Tax=Corynebacterium frankenforstense DSM 45800 TaxID=1437875 RepID=A0A1L7CT93_9CORY|nr:LPXTG cell wall anchor domain-containing protein [Corynebacterium frankenforstense]APT88988.1 hypothetical protein CFRA_06685 [Corynebacterium frankenforstense DSM 45800]